MTFPNTYLCIPYYSQSKEPLFPFTAFTECSLYSQHIQIEGKCSSYINLSNLTWNTKENI
jgi:hypothetical protein